MNTVFPEVRRSKFSGLKSTAVVEEAARARKKADCFIMVMLWKGMNVLSLFNISMVSYFVLQIQTN